MTLQARYTILRKIADGGTAEIFLATQHGAHGFEKTVVLKRIFPAFYADPHFRHMLVDEAHIAMSLNHNNIVQVLDLGEADGQYTLAMDLVDGWTLDAVLRRARALNTGLPPALALYLTAEVCRALAYAHAKTAADGTPLGIVHRDISPHNVLLSDQGEVKLSDFGIAKAHNRRESSGEAVIKGKIAYMSPEQAAGRDLDLRSDLFSVGTMLYVMVCRRYPFDAPTDLDVLLLVKKGEGVPPETAQPGLNPEIYRLLHRAMAQAPADRYQRAEDMLVDVEHVMRMAFRAVGQTELKRWLQDLSMRDGVPPLTRMPAIPWSPSQGHDGGREIVELNAVGTSLPPPAPGSGSTAAPHAAPAPFPRPPRATPPPARPQRVTPPPRPGLTGKTRPPPPAQAMAVRRTTGSVAVVGALASSERSGPDGRSAPHAEFDSTATTPPPARVDAGASDSSPASMGDGTGSGLAHERRVAAAASGEAMSPEAAAARPVLDKTPSAMFETHPPAAPRKSSTWVAEAVAASAQRAGIAPPPPVDQVVVVAPPTPFAIPRVVPAPVAPAAVPPAPAPAPRRTALGAVVGIAALLLVGLTVKMCGRESAPAREASPSKTAVPPPSAANHGPIVPGPGPGPGAPATPRPTVTGVPRASGSPRPLVAEATSPRATGTGPTPPGGLAETRTKVESPTKDQPPPAPPKHEVVPPHLDERAGTVAQAERPAATTSPTSSPTAGRGGPAAKDDGSDRSDRSDRVAATEGTAPSKANRVAVAAGPAGTAGPNADNEGDPSDSPPPSGTPPSTGPERVSVLLKSRPTGAQVATAHLNFGTTPVSVRFKPGHNYTLYFSRDGYRPVAKKLRIGADAGQEWVVVLRRASTQKSEGAGQDPSPVPPSDKSAPANKSKQDGWFGRMFGR